MARHAGHEVRCDGSGLTSDISRGDDVAAEAERFAAKEATTEAGGKAGATKTANGSSTTKAEEPQTGTVHDYRAAKCWYNDSSRAVVR